MLQRVLHLYGTPIGTRVQAHRSIIASISRAYDNHTANIPRSRCQDWQGCCRHIALVAQSHPIIRKHIHMAAPPYVYHIQLLLHTICLRTYCNHIAIRLQAYANYVATMFQSYCNHVATMSRVQRSHVAICIGHAYCTHVAIILRAYRSHIAIVLHRVAIFLR